MGSKKIFTPSALYIGRFKNAEGLKLISTRMPIEQSYKARRTNELLVCLSCPVVDPSGPFVAWSAAYSQQGAGSKLVCSPAAVCVRAYLSLAGRPLVSERASEPTDRQTDRSMRKATDEQ